MKRRSARLAAALLLTALATVQARAQVVLGSNLQYNWTATSAATSGQLGLYIVLNGLNAPRPSNYRIDWTVSGTAPGACTFNAQGSADNVTWTNVDGGSAVSCATSSAEIVTSNPVLFLRINLASFTSGDSTTKVVFHYTGSPGGGSGGTGIPPGWICTGSGTSQVCTAPGTIAAPTIVLNGSDLGTLLGLKAPLASPALTGTPTAPTQAANDNSTDIATDAFVNQQIPQGGVLVPGAQAVYLAYKDGSGTTLHDQSGNGYNCTFAAGTSAPTWLNTATINFNPTVANQSITCPFQVLQNAQTIEMWFQLVTPLYNDGAATAEVYLLSDNAGHGVAMIPSRFGMMAQMNGSAEQISTVDRLAGNTSWSLVCAAGSPVYVNGHLGTGSFALTSCPTWSTSGTVSIGTYTPGGGAFGASMNLYAIAVYSSALTPAQIAQNDTFVKTQLYQHDVQSFVEAKNPALVIAQGDSRTVNYPIYQLVNSRPWLWSNLEPDREQFYNFGVASRTLATILTNLPNVEYPLLSGNSSASKTILLDACTNDMKFNATTGVACYVQVATYCKNIHLQSPGARVIYATSVARTDMTSGQEAQRESLNSLITSAWTNGSFPCDGVDDIANDPLAATQVVPNGFNPSGASSYNATWFGDGIHETPAMNSELSTQESVSLLAGQNRLRSCKIVNKTIPYQVLTAANTASPSTSQTINLLQLGPGWQVCSLATNVSIPFVGTSVIASTISFGDSSGTTTQYLGTQDMLTATSQTLAGPTYISPAGTVQMSVAATGANLTAFTAGEIDVAIGVTSGPPTNSAIYTNPLLVPGLRAWYDASTLGLTNGAGVTSWPDSSGNGHTLTSVTTAPTFNTAQVNGLPAIHFSGDGFELRSTGWSTPGPFTVFFVYKYGSGNIMLDGNSNSAYFYMTGSTMNLHYGSVDNNVSTSTDTTNYHVLAQVWNGSSSQIYKFLTSTGLSAPSSATTSLSNGLNVGNYSQSGGFGWTGNIAEIIVYSGALTSAQRTGITNYLGTKYSLSN